jgi:hypothetical protein
MEWDSELGIVVFSIAGSLFFPALWQMIFFKGEGQRIANYLLVSVGSGLFSGVLSILANSMNNEAFVWLFAFSPLNFIVISENSSSTDRELILTAAVIVDAMIACALVVGALRNRRRTTMNHLETLPGGATETP